VITLDYQLWHIYNGLEIVFSDSYKSLDLLYSSVRYLLQETCAVDRWKSEHGFRLSRLENLHDSPLLRQLFSLVSVRLNVV
jgi:hypothetical protein